jgi:twitching motility protein PilT
MVTTTTIQEYIADPDKTHMISDAISEGFVAYQMQTFDQSLMQLFRQGRITLDEAMRASSNPHELSLRIKGIHSSSDTTWDRFEGAGQESAPEPRVGGSKDDFVKL